MLDDDDDEGVLRRFVNVMFTQQTFLHPSHPRIKVCESLAVAVVVVVVVVLFTL